MAAALNITVRDLFPAKSEFAANKKGIPVKITDRQIIISKIMRDLNKASADELKKARRIIKILIGIVD